MPGAAQGEQSGSSYVVSLDADLRVDCVAHVDGWLDSVAAAPDGGFYVAHEAPRRLVTRFC